MRTEWSPFKWVVDVSKLFLGSVLFMFLCSCQKHDTTTAAWHPVAPVGFAFTASNDGLYKVSLGIPAREVVAAVAGLVNQPAAVRVEALPINALGVFSIEHDFDMRQDATYIVIRNREKGIDQIFQVGVRGYVELDLSGEHKLLLHNEGENKFVLEDVSFAPITIKFYPQGEERANVSFESGPDFVFLTDHRLHIEYPSLSHPSMMGFNLNNSLFKKDDTVSLDSIQSITFNRDFHVSQLILNWKPPITNRDPLVINLPVGGDELRDEVTRLQSTLNAIAPGVHFDKVTLQKGHALLWKIGIFLFVSFIGISAMLFKKAWGVPDGMGCAFISMLFFLLLMVCVYVLVIRSDSQYWDFPM